LTHRKSAAMDKLMYYVRNTDKAIEESVPDLSKFMEDVELSGNRAEVTEQAIDYFLGTPSRTRQADIDYLAQDDDMGEVCTEDSDSDDSQSDEGDLVDDLDDENKEDNNPQGLGSHILHVWKKRRKRMVSNYAITG
jgi:hypothetical protein